MDCHRFRCRRFLVEGCNLVQTFVVVFVVVVNLGVVTFQFLVSIVVVIFFMRFLIVVPSLI